MPTQSQYGFQAFNVWMGDVRVKMSPVMKLAMDQKCTQHEAQTITSIIWQSDTVTVTEVNAKSKYGVVV